MPKPNPRFNQKGKSVIIPRVISFDQSEMFEYVTGASKRKQIRRLEYQRRQKDINREARVSSRAETRAITRREPEVLEGFPLPTKNNVYNLEKNSSIKLAKTLDNWNEYDDVIQDLKGEHDHLNTERLDVSVGSPPDQDLQNQKEKDNIYSTTEAGGLPGQPKADYTTQVTVTSLHDHTDDDSDDDEEFQDFDLSSDSDMDFDPHFSDQESNENIGKDLFASEESHQLTQNGGKTEVIITSLYDDENDGISKKSSSHTKQKQPTSMTTKGKKRRSNPKETKPQPQNLNLVNEFQKEFFINPRTTVELSRPKRNKKGGKNKKNDNRFAWNKNTAIKMRKKRIRSECKNGKNQCKRVKK